MQSNPLDAICVDSKPDVVIDVREVFGIDTEMQISGFSESSANVPDKIDGYAFDPDTTLAILAGFSHDRRVMLQGLHGTGKSSHIEQVASRLNWPCLRVNLDSNISRLDLIGRDAIVVEDGKQRTVFQEGILPWAMQRPVALIFDEYDAGRPDVMFLLQRLLENEGKLTLLEQNRVVSSHPSFRLFATANTVGLGDATGLYHGTQQLNQAQMDRWHIVSKLEFLPFEQELALLQAQVKGLTEEQQPMLGNMVAMAQLTREGFKHGDISTLMSLRTLLTWADNFKIFGDLALAFKVSFLNRCDEEERMILSEYYQRCFDTEIMDYSGALSFA
ncbi:Aerobic cobaltochelatase subunit CobS [BD1-7 clade bacterium]|uniref:Aerobic cobaltochelatase subunit CobS n=1 Tax=BD1-7 clade bacterium TaxID=2029982 RepID=A0A5S9PUV7_9GAMM|nr:Aerobic cobaltochelatase subunit CobS [BD1-7 clade bacterium]